MKTRFQFNFVQTEQIDAGHTLTDFSLGADPPHLQRSVEEIGLTHPLVLTPDSEGYRIVCGHRRMRAARALGLQNLPANLLPAKMSDEKRLAFNLTENDRRYSDIETAAILCKLSHTSAEKDRIIGHYMPLLSLERSKKLLHDFLETEKFSRDLKQLLHNLNIPIRVYTPMFRWDNASQQKAEIFFSALRPGVNKWRELLELIGETSRRDGVSPGDILDREELCVVLQNGEPKYDEVRKILRRWRFPTLHGLRKEVLLTLDKLNLDGKTKIRADENFENKTIKIELAFRTQEELSSQMEPLSKASRSQAMRDLIRVFKNQG